MFFRQQSVQLLLLLLVTALLYFPVVQFDFLDYDDKAYILEDPAIQELTLPNLRTIFLEPYIAVWYPLARLSHAFDIALFGHDAAGHHAVSSLLHFLNAAILLQVLLFLGSLAYPEGERKRSVFYPAFITSILFVVHPQHVEAVAWAVQRKELLASMFALLSIAAYLRHRLTAVCLFLLLAMLSKPSAVLFPVFFILLDTALVEPKDMNIKRLFSVLLSKWWMILLALAFALVTFRNVSQESALWLNEQFSLPTRVLLYTDNSLHGLSGFFTLRAGLFTQPINDYVISGGWLAGASLAVVLLLLSVCAALLFLGNRPARIGAAGLLLYFTALLPAGGLIVYGNFAFGDRYLYLSSIGIYVFLFIGLCELFRRCSAGRLRQWLFTLMSILLLVALMLSHRVLPKWASTQTVWLYDVQQRPDSVLANYMLGTFYLFDKRDPQLALSYFDAVINSKSEPFRIGPRTASAIYLAQILCQANLDDMAITVLARIPDFGGDISDVEPLLDSLRHTGKVSCAEAISDWYDSTRLSVSAGY